MIIGEGKKLSQLLVQDQVFQNVHPTLEIVSPINNCLIPDLRYLFYSVSVPKPANIGEVRSNHVEFFLHLPRPGHKRCVGQGQGDLVLPEQVCKFGIEPGLVSNLDYKFVVGGKLLQEGREHTEKTILFREFPAVEDRKLKDDRTKLRAENIHRFHELFEFGIAID